MRNQRPAQSAVSAALALVVAACVTPRERQRLAHCESLVEIVEAEAERVAFSEDVRRVYAECVERLAR